MHEDAPLSTESTGSPLVKLWSTVSVVKGLVASIASDVAERTNRTLERAKALKKVVESINANQLHSMFLYFASHLSYGA